MKKAPVIDLSLRAPRQMIAAHGVFRGCVAVLWFRLVRPSLVGSVWAMICVYTYRNLLPFNPVEMPIEQIVFYASCISVIAAAIATWLITARVLHPLTYRIHASHRLHRTASLKAKPGSIAAMVNARRLGEPQASRILIASHDAHGSISGIKWMSRVALQAGD
jgi:hypothetical protein